MTFISCAQRNACLNQFCSYRLLLLSSECISDRCSCSHRRGAASVQMLVLQPGLSWGSALMAGISPLHLTSSCVGTLWQFCTLKTVSYLMQYSMMQYIISSGLRLLQDVMNINNFNWFHKLSGKFMEEQATESYQVERWRLSKRSLLSYRWLDRVGSFSISSLCF